MLIPNILDGKGSGQVLGVKTPEDATVEEIGIYTGTEPNGTILLASFNAG